MILSKSQQGMTMGSLLIFLILGVVMLYGIFRLLPVYMEHYSVVNILQALEKEPSLQGGESEINSSSAIRGILHKHFEESNITHVKAEDVQLASSPDGTNVRVAYDVNVPFMANIDLLLHFDNTVQVQRK